MRSDYYRKSLTVRATAKLGWVMMVLFALVSPARACPMCKDSTVTASDQQPAASEAGLSFNKSIYFMLGGLFSVAGFTGRVMYRAAAVRK